MVIGSLIFGIIRFPPLPWSHTKIWGLLDSQEIGKGHLQFIMISATIIIMLVHIAHRSLGTQRSEPYQGTLPKGIKASKMLREGTIQDITIGQVSFNEGIITCLLYSISLRDALLIKCYFLYLIIITYAYRKLILNLYTCFVAELFDTVINKTSSNIKIHYIRIKLCEGSGMEILF